MSVISVECAACLRGKHRISATRIGAFAVHRYWNHVAAFRRGRWTVTHVPSGRAIGQMYPTKALATAAARAMLKLDIDWNSVTSGDSVPKRIRKQAEKIAMRHS